MSPPSNLNIKIIKWKNYVLVINNERRKGMAKRFNLQASNRQAKGLILLFSFNFI